MPTVHDPMFALTPRPPFRFGQSPFRARGIIYVQDIAHYEQVLPGGVGALLRRIGDPDMDAFVKRSFFALGWYDMMPLHYLCDAAARLRGTTYSLMAKELTTAHAARTVEGFSGVVLRMLSHEAIAAWLPRISAFYHDFGGIKTHVTEPGVVRGERSGMPRMFVQPWALAAATFTEEVLLRAGARDARVHMLSADRDGESAGMETYRVGFEIRWRAR